MAVAAGGGRGGGCRGSTHTLCSLTRRRSRRSSCSGGGLSDRMSRHEGEWPGGIRSDARCGRPVSPLPNADVSARGRSLGRRVHGSAGLPGPGPPPPPLWCSRLPFPCRPRPCDMSPYNPSAGTPFPPHPSWRYLVRLRARLSGLLFLAGRGLRPYSRCLGAPLRSPLSLLTHVYRVSGVCAGVWAAGVPGLQGGCWELAGGRGPGGGIALSSEGGGEPWPHTGTSPSLRCVYTLGPGRLAR